METELTNEQAWANAKLNAYPYVFAPTKTLTTKELTELLSYFFAVKPVSQGFYDNLPANMQQHFKPLEENK